MKYSPADFRVSIKDEIEIKESLAIKA